MVKKNEYKGIITPNVLTVFRFFVTGAILWLLSKSTLSAHFWAIGLFVVAVVTDFLDGYLARKYDLITNFGKIADPIADKFLILGLFVSFTYLDLYHFSWILPIMIREVVVTILRLILLFQGQVIAAEKLGKYKVAFQVGCLCLSWIYLLVREFGFRTALYNYAEQFQLAMYVTLFISIILTVYSGITFLIANHKAIAHAGFANVIGTFFGCGNTPKLPGTAGTLGAVLFYVLIHNSPLYLSIIAITLIIGTWSARYVSAVRKVEDPQEVVIDEVVGYLITMYLVPFSWVTVVCGFLLFRLFDIFKPGPIKLVEKVPHGYGIMLDDILAGIFANILLQILYYKVLINF